MLANLLSQVGIPRQFTGDIIIAVLFILATVVITTLVKKRNLGALLISIYISFALLAKLFFDFAQGPYAKITIFVVCVAVLFSLLKNDVRIRIKGKKISMWLKISLTALAIVGFFASIVLQWIPGQIVQDFMTEYASAIFMTPQAQLVWMIAPLVVIFMLKNKR